MIKYIIVLLMSFGANASYIDSSEVGDCATKPKFYLKKSKCEDKEKNKCAKVEKDYRCEYGKKKFKLKDDINNPQYSNISNQELCSGEEDCLFKRSALDCEPSRKFSSQDYTSVFCADVAYPQIESDELVVFYDEQKKSDYDAARLATKEAKEQLKIKAKSILSRIKSGEKLKEEDIEDALEYILGGE